MKCLVVECNQPAELWFVGDGVCSDHYAELENWAKILRIRKLFETVLETSGWVAAESLVEKNKELWLVGRQSPDSDNEEDYPTARTERQGCFNF